MPFKITITKIEEKKVVTKGEHTVIREEPWTKEEIHEKVLYEKVENFLEREPVKRVYGYAPAFEDTKIVETQILQQTVEELDLAGVVRAINKL